MFGELFKRFSDSLGLTKRNSPLGGLFNKAKGIVSSGLDFLRSKPVKNVVDSVSQFIPSVRNYYDDAKKYGAIVGNVLGSNALAKKGDRFIKKEKATPTIERVPRVEFRKPSSMFDDPQERMAML